MLDRQGGEDQQEGEGAKAVAGLGIVERGIDQGEIDDRRKEQGIAPQIQKHADDPEGQQQGVQQPKSGLGRVPDRTLVDAPGDLVGASAEP